MLRAQSEVQRILNSQFSILNSQLSIRSVFFVPAINHLQLTLLYFPPLVSKPNSYRNRTIRMVRATGSRNTNELSRPLVRSAT